MEGCITLETDRLILRQWKQEDWPLFAAINSDPVVMKYFPNPLSETESNTIADKIHALITEQGWGFWAVEEKLSGLFTGFVGLNKVLPVLPFYPAIEIGWHLARSSWGQGYATEAANTVLKFAFDKLNVDEVCSFASVNNTRSIAVMQRLNMVNTQQNFEHPVIPAGNLLREHVLYKLTRGQWQSTKINWNRK